MINRVSKGSRIERKLKNLLSREFLVGRVEYRVKYSTKDLFNLFDFIFLSEDRIGFVQVTTNSPHSHKPYEEFAKRYSNVEVYQFVWHDRKGWVVYYYSPKKIIMDFRGKKMRFKIPYKFFVELSNTKVIQNLYSKKKIITLNYGKEENDIVIEIEVDDLSFISLMKLPDKYRNELFKYRLKS